jgi:hypothetical protein
MWTNEQIQIDIEAVEGNEVIVRFTGVMHLLGSVSLVGRILTIDRVHVQGLRPGSLGRSGLNAIGRKLLVEADVDTIIVQGGVRTTGCNKGKLPKPIRFPNG